MDHSVDLEVWLEAAKTGHMSPPILKIILQSVCPNFVRRLSSQRLRKRDIPSFFRLPDTSNVTKRFTIKIAGCETEIKQCTTL